MRFRSALLVATLICTAGSAYAARVLVPGDTASKPLATQPTPQTDSTKLGLVPQATAPTQQDVAKPTQEVPVAPSPIDSTPLPTGVPAGAIDAVNLDVIKNAKIEDIRKSLPPEFNSLSDTELKKFLSSSIDKLKADNVAKYLKKDPKTGQVYLDTDMIMNEKPVQKNVQISTGGGKIAPRVPTEEEAAVQKLKDKMGNMKYKIDPRIQRMMDLQKQENEAEEKKRERDPIFINDLNMEPFETPLMQSSINMGLSKEYLIGQSAVKIIKRTLGYEDEAILARCQLRLDTYLKTDDNQLLYRSSLYSNTQKTLKYGGMLQTIEATPLVVCLKPDGALPRKGGVIFKIGDKYGVSFSRTSCAAPAHDPKKNPPKAVLLKYNGDQGLECTFKD